MGKGLLLDVTRCIGCGLCRDACRAENGLPETQDEGLSEHRFTTLRKMDAGGGRTRWVRRLCMHCLRPTCESVCPVGALRRTEDGPVLYDAGRCIGCRYCMMACPYGVPRYEWRSVAPRVRKCVMCSGRLARGLPTACAEACPFGATVFGERADLLRVARERSSDPAGGYVRQVFGETEGGGTSVLVLADVPFAVLGFPAGLPGHPLGEYTGEVLSKLPNVVVVGGALLAGLYWVINRRDTLAGGGPPA